MKQMTFADAEYAGKRKQTRRELFLIEMARSQVVPWQGHGQWQLATALVATAAGGKYLCAGARVAAQLHARDAAKGGISLRLIRGCMAPCGVHLASPV